MGIVAQTSEPVKVRLNLRQTAGAVNRATSVWVATATEFLVVPVSKAAARRLLRRARWQGYRKAVGFLDTDGGLILEGFAE